MVRSLHGVCKWCRDLGWRENMKLDAVGVASFGYDAWFCLACMSEVLSHPR